MHPYIFSIEIPWFNFTLEPRYYGLFYAIAVLIGSRIVLSEIKRRRIHLQEDEALNMTLLIFLVGLIGGRVYEVILSGQIITDFSHSGKRLLYGKVVWQFTELS